MHTHTSKNKHTHKNIKETRRLTGSSRSPLPTTTPITSLISSPISHRNHLQGGVRALLAVQRLFSASPIRRHTHTHARFSFWRTLKEQTCKTIISGGLPFFFARRASSSAPAALPGGREGRGGRAPRPRAPFPGIHEACYAVLRATRPLPAGRANKKAGQALGAAATWTARRRRARRAVSDWPATNTVWNRQKTPPPHPIFPSEPGQGKPNPKPSGHLGRQVTRSVLQNTEY